ncbi:uncharacterized protein B0H18DRAFT_585321 [Fomitopsis serialis]|uniref:uncharacterized protein n=1 Tax=Fomitopsis serialis TaxID=139415 RepID=UPI002008D2EE|nr:uncharacterized protein B0H18DRAFT_585321 [Neoantrodia serialis]KAH9920681.1 hypothetical protein B0H18DRAFT_585321 [Neoantrodia serialis]
MLACSPARPPAVCNAAAWSESPPLAYLLSHPTLSALLYVCQRGPVLSPALPRPHTLSCFQPSTLLRAHSLGFLFPHCLALARPLDLTLEHCLNGLILHALILSPARVLAHLWFDMLIRWLVGSLAHPLALAWPPPLTALTCLYIIALSHAPTSSRLRTLSPAHPHLRNLSPASPLARTPSRSHTLSLAHPLAQAPLARTFAR